MPDAPLSLTLKDISFIGDRLKRPECVLAVKTGEVFASDARGGVSVTYPDGRSRLIKAKGAPTEIGRAHV